MSFSSNDMFLVMENEGYISRSGMQGVCLYTVADSTFHGSGDELRS